MANVTRGQGFYYSVNVEAAPGTDDASLFSANWNEVAQRVCQAAASFASARVVSAGDTNITLAVTSRMDRASEDDIRGNLDAIVQSQPEVKSLHGSVIRLTDSGINPAGATPAASPFANITPTMWAIIGLGFFFLLKR